MAAQASDFYSSNLVNLLTDMCAHHVDNKVEFEAPMAAKGFWCNMEVTREQTDTTAESYNKGSYATGDDIMAGMVLTKNGKLDYPKPPPKSLSIAPSGPKVKAVPPPPKIVEGMSTSTSVILALLGIGFAVVMAVVCSPCSLLPLSSPSPSHAHLFYTSKCTVYSLALASRDSSGWVVPFSAPQVIAPESDYFVGNVMVFVLASVLGYCLVMSVKPSLHTPLMSMSNAISGIVVLGGMSACDLFSDRSNFRARALRRGSAVLSA